MTATLISDERLERALVAAAFVVEMYGVVYAPIFERLEREVEARKNADGPRARARRLLESRTVDGFTPTLEPERLSSPTTRA